MRSNGSFVPLGARFVLGFCFVMKGLHKFGLFGGPGPGMFGDYLGTLGIAVPELTAYVIAIAEIAAGAALLLGAFHKVAAVVVIGIMAGAMWFATGHAYFLPGGFEYNLALIALAATVYANGPGPFAYRVQFKKQDEDGR